MRARPGTVLVVTGDVRIGASLCAAFERLGLPGVHVTSATEAIHRLSEDAPSAIVVDLQFSELAPEQLVKRALVCRETHGSPVVLLATTDDDPGRDVWIARGCADVRARDADPHETASLVRDHVRQTH
jgi:PleD family two-component response regulator